MSNVDINVDRPTDRLTDRLKENWTPILHPATSRCDNETRIPWKASSHLLGQKSQEPQSEHGY